MKKIVTLSLVAAMSTTMAFGSTASDLRAMKGLQKDLFKAYVLGMRFDLKNIAPASFHFL